MEILRPSSSETRPTRARNIPSPVSSDAKLDLLDLYCILQIDPNDSYIAMELARRLQKLNRLDEAYKILVNVLKIDSRFETLNALAQIEYQIEKFDDAFHHLQQAVLIAPENDSVLFEVFKTLGNIFVRKGDFESAEDSYNKAHRIEPNSDSLHVNFGTLAIQRSDWDTAADRFRYALTINPTNDKAWVGVALAHRMKGDFDLSWGNIEAALEYGPLNETALGLALEWSTYDGREFRALELIRAYLIAGGWSERLSLAFSWLSWRRGEGDKARLELERLLAVNPRNLQALSLLAEMRNPL